MYIIIFQLQQYVLYNGEMVEALPPGPSWQMPGQSDSKPCDVGHGTWTPEPQHHGKQVTKTSENQNEKYMKRL